MRNFLVAALYRIGRLCIRWAARLDRRPLAFMYGDSIQSDGVEIMRVTGKPNAAQLDLLRKHLRFPD